MSRNPAPGGAAPDSEHRSTEDLGTETLRAEGFTGRIDRRYLPPGGEAARWREIHRLLDPAVAEETLHWGRNYLYRVDLATVHGPLPVVVKQFPGGGWRKRLRRKLKDSKAKRSWNVARALTAAGIATPGAVFLVESTDPDGPTYFACRHLEGVLETRCLLRAMNAGRAAEEFPRLDPRRFLDTLGRFVRRLHDAGFWHRDLSSGNVLLRPREGSPPELFLVDLNRTRQPGRVSHNQRLRDLSRMMLHRRRDQDRYLQAYWGDDRRRPVSRLLYRLYFHAFHGKHAAKNRWRALLGRVRNLLFTRGTHAHIPDAPEDAPTRERVVWDHLSDQPHLHAGRWQKLRVRLADADAHLSQNAALLRALPRIRRRYKELQRSLHGEPVPFTGAGVALRPWPESEGKGGGEVHPRLLALVEDLLPTAGPRPVLIRLHPWQEHHDAEEALARELAGRGHELTFTLPQNRELVRDLAEGGRRWRDALEELAERFVPFGRRFQVGQAVNRSKWGVWNAREWSALTASAEEVLRRHGEVEILGPAVIDFELHQTAGLVNLRRDDVHLDALASLLYVDRRGAPENRQLGFDTVDKVVLLQAIADTARLCGPRSWITEVNWPLREGPHSPAGKSVSVDEETQADYLVRFFILALATGLVERVFWWRMVARGYGLVAPPREADPHFRRRPSFDAYSHLLRRLEGATSHGPLPRGDQGPDSETRAYHFTTRSGEELVVAWAVGSRPAAVELPSPPEAAWSRDGEEQPPPDGLRVEVGPSPRYFRLSTSP